MSAQDHSERTAGSQGETWAAGVCVLIGTETSRMEVAMRQNLSPLLGADQDRLLWVVFSFSPVLLMQSLQWPLDGAWSSDSELGPRALGLPRWLRGKEPACQCRRRGLDPWVREIPWRKKTATLSGILAWRIPGTEESDF